MSARAFGKDVCCRRYLLFNIFFVAAIVLVLKRFAADPVIISDLVCMYACMYICMYGHTYSKKGKDQPGKFANSAVVS